MVFGALAPLLDSTMTNVAIDTIVVSMETTVSVVQWVTTGYMLAMGLSVPITVWAVKRFGSRRMYLVSLGVFLAGSILSSLSWNIDSLIVFRFLQGIGAGIIMPTLMTEIVEISGNRNLGRIMSIISFPALLAPILGPVLGGIIVNGLGWRWIFYVNIPVTVIAFILAIRTVPADKLSGEKQSLDMIGILLLSPALAILIYGIAQISIYDGLGSSAVYITLAIGSALLIAFIIYGLNTKKEPILNLRLFASTNFAVANILLFLSGIITNGAMFILPLYYQDVRRQSVLFAALWLIPQGIGMLLTRSWAGRVADRDGPRNVMLFSLIVAALGTMPFAFADTASSPVLLAVTLLVRGAGMGGIFIVAMSSAYTGLSNDHVPHASSTTRIFQNIGGAFGSAILSTVLQRQMTNHASDPHGVAGAFNVAFGWMVAFTVVAVIPALFLPMHNKVSLKSAMKDA
jgi:EmrB/QacA subfamily drug resistance transporter